MANRDLAIAAAYRGEFGPLRDLGYSITTAAVIEAGGRTPSEIPAAVDRILAEQGANDGE